MKKIKGRKQEKSNSGTPMPSRKPKLPEGSFNANFVAVIAAQATSSPAPRCDLSILFGLITSRAQCAATKGLIGLQLVPSSPCHKLHICLGEHSQFWQKKGVLGSCAAARERLWDPAVILWINRQELHGMRDHSDNLG